MKVILKENIKGIGRKFEVKEVSDGYANNFLIPKRLAEYASSEAVKRYEALKAAAAAEMEVREKLAENQMEALKDVKIIIRKRGNAKGHLFEKVHEEELSQALKEQANIDLAPEFLSIAEPIKEAGEHEVSVEVGKSKGKFKVILEAQS
jgi:large subunit ribosomal protein L9